MTSAWIDAFVRDLAGVRLPGTFNPLADRCEVHDLADAPMIRSENFRRLLSAYDGRHVPSIWFGRELGYRGGRRTGLALTDEGNLQIAGSLLGAQLKRSTIGAPMVERTATVVWSLIGRLPDVPVLWNAFPLHAHEPGNPMSNRTHTAAERRVTAWTINALVTHLRPEKLIAIGNDASAALQELGFDHLRVRHPSYGGQREFLKRMEAFHSIGPDAIAAGDLFAA